MIYNRGKGEKVQSFHIDIRPKMSVMTTQLVFELIYNDVELWHIRHSAWGSPLQRVCWSWIKFYVFQYVFFFCLSLPVHVQLSWLGLLNRPTASQQTHPRAPTSQLDMTLNHLLEYKLPFIANTLRSTLARSGNTDSGPIYLSIYLSIYQIEVFNNLLDLEIFYCEQAID